MWAIYHIYIALVDVTGKTKGSPFGDADAELVAYPGVSQMALCLGS